MDHPLLELSQTVAALVPQAFESYVRLLNPVEIPYPGEGTTTWAAIGKRLGMEIGPETGWQDIEDNPGYTDELGEPTSGTMPIEMARHLATLLGGSANSEVETFGMMWAGYAEIPRAASATTTVGFENDMHVFTGGLREIASEHWNRVPMHWWPADRSWYVGGDVYGRSVYVGAARDVTRLLLSEFEGFEVAPATRLPFEP
jgi:hypothetical protein